MQKNIQWIYYSILWLDYENSLLFIKYFKWNQALSAITDQIIVIYILC